MKTYLDCYPCFLRQTLTVSRKITSDLKKQKEILNKVMDVLKNYDFNSSPPEISRGVYKIIREITGVNDPYYGVRKKNNEKFLKMYDELRSRIIMDRFPLFMATRIASIGNLVDYGVGKTKEVGDLNDIEVFFDKMPTINQFLDLKKDISYAKNILYLGDNSGEIVLDKLLIEFIKREFPDKKITYAVRGFPIINDVTLNDAKEVSIEEFADQVIPNGDSSPGTILKYCSDEFLEVFKNSDLIIAKGQGNYESLSDLNDNRIYFLLLAKCPVIARDLGVGVGSLIIKKGGEE